MDCYRFESISGRKPLFAHIDATYVIHLENNGRLQNVKRQLHEYYPSKNTCILYNKGFKNCEKHLPKNETQFDLVDANLFIFRDAQKKHYKNILILEDDFFFHKDVRNHTEEVDRFIRKNQEEEFMYFLGCLPVISFPLDIHMIHYKVPVGACAQAVIYSSEYRENLLSVKQQDISDWDIFQITFRPFDRVMYHMPLCYQLFPKTENSTNWGNHNIILKFICANLFQLLQLFKLNVQVDPGYSICYMFSKSIVWLVIITCICINYPLFFRPKYTQKSRH